MSSRSVNIQEVLLPTKPPPNGSSSTSSSSSGKMGPTAKGIFYPKNRWSLVKGTTTTNSNIVMNYPQSNYKLLSRLFKTIFVRTFGYKLTWINYLIIFVLFFFFLPFFNAGIRILKGPIFEAYICEWECNWSMLLTSLPWSN